MENKITDKEIIKILENCADGTGKGIIQAVLDLFNRQKAEIEMLESEMDKQYETAEASIRAEIASGGTSCHWCEDIIKARAIKAYAERLCEGRVSNDPIVIAVKVELQEMIGAQE